MGDYSNYKNAELGDERLSNRFVRLLGQLSGKPGANILEACQDPYQAKAAYRFISNEEVTTEAITGITHELTMEKIYAAMPSVLLILQDTTELNYSTLKATEGLGNIARKKASLGMELHTAIAIGDNGEVYGLLSQKLWTRQPENYGQSDATRKKLPIEEKESIKWLEALEDVGTSFPEGTTVLHVCDAEGDIYELFCKAKKECVQYLCRVAHNRNVGESNESAKLNDFVDGLPIAGKVNIHIPRDSRTKREARNSEFEIKHGKCKVKKPSNMKGNSDLPDFIELYVVSAVEIDPPEGQEKISWQLVTNVPTECFEDAVTRIAWYTQRWKIETFHRTLKSGCKVEELQSDTAYRLMKLITIYSIIALEIMHLTYIARTRPDESCETVLTEEEWKILYRIANKTKKMPEKVPTIYEAVVMIAKLGGFGGRKSDGFPGVTVIWRGLTSFYVVLDALPFL